MAPSMVTVPRMVVSVDQNTVLWTNQAGRSVDYPSYVELRPACRHTCYPLLLVLSNLPVPQQCIFSLGGIGTRIGLCSASMTDVCTAAYVVKGKLYSSQCHPCQATGLWPDVLSIHASPCRVCGCVHFSPKEIVGLCRYLVTLFKERKVLSTHTILMAQSQKVPQNVRRGIAGAGLLAGLQDGDKDLLVPCIRLTSSTSHQHTSKGARIRSVGRLGAACIASTFLAKAHRPTHRWLISTDGPLTRTSGACKP